MSTRKRGKRRKNRRPPKRFRDLIKNARAERELQAALQEESEDETLSSVESDQNEQGYCEPRGWRAIEAEMSSLLTEIDVEEMTTPQAEINDDGMSISQEFNDEGEREMSWSPSPDREINVIQAQTSIDEQEEFIVIEEDDDSPIQPLGEYCIVICRLSSPKYEGKKGTLDQRREAYNERRRVEGRELGRRLAANCPTPITFREIFSTCHKRGCMERTNWAATVRPSGMVIDIRGWFQRPIMRGKKATVLIRAIDGVTCHVDSFKSFLKMMIDAGVEVQLIFQYNQVYDQIRPLRLRNFRGLGGTADFMAADFLAHIEGTKIDPAVARILAIWQLVEDQKTNQIGIQDRNGLLGPDAEGPVQGYLGGQVGR